MLCEPVLIEHNLILTLCVEIIGSPCGQHVPGVCVAVFHQSKDTYQEDLRRELPIRMNVTVCFTITVMDRFPVHEPGRK